VLAHALAMKHRNICVVGDPDQSIYAWRGADIQNIMDFEKDYPDAKVVKLEQNYRSTKTILAIAGTLIARNNKRKEKALWTENAQGEKAKLFLCQDEYDEAAVVAGQLKELHEKHHYPWNKMAIFYRMNSLSRVMEDALRRENLPYVMARGVEFYNRKEIKDTLAYLRVIANPSDEVSLTRIVNVPARGIGDSTVKLVQAYAVSHGLSLFSAMEHAGQQSASVQGLSSRAVNSIRAFVEMIRQWRTGSEEYAGSLDDTFVFSAPNPQQTTNNKQPARGPVQTLMEDVIRRSGLEAFYKKEGGDEQSELANIDQLITSAAEFDREQEGGTLEEYLSMISLVSDVDHLKGNGGAITMMTLHAAKGLEFPVVAMIGLEDGCLPHSRARESAHELEEERRLCFVGITRAQERLILTKAQYRTMRGLRERTATSQFLAEMPGSDIEIIDRSGLSPAYTRPSGFSPRNETGGAKFRTGQLVRHRTFGIGRITEISDSADARATVQFNEVGQKRMVVDYLEPIR
jgi:DNA helicase-2/ATP-dependent DNA helicase PcrA